MERSLAPWSVPEVRSDCRYRLALLFADICYLDSLVCHLPCLHR